ncbi:reverse transcriptase domain-containing protein [Tanacetum coccineum]
MMERRRLFLSRSGAGKKEQNQNCLLTMDDGVVNWEEHTANEIYAKDEKLKKYRRIGMKAVKEKEQLQKTGPQKPEISDSDDTSNEHSSCQLNDSEGSFVNPSEHSSESELESISVPNEMSTSKSVIANEKVDHPLKNMEDRGIFDSGCSGHMTGNKDHLDDFEECKGGSVTFGGDVKAITTRSGVAYDGPTIPPTPSPLPKEVERETEMTKEKVQNTSLGSTAHVQPPIVQDPIPESKVISKPKPKPSIPYPSRLNDQKLCEKANNQMLKFLQTFQRLHFNISFTDALLHMLKFASTFKSLLSNKEKLFKLENTPLNENCLTLDECLALADLGASINLMPLSVWKQLSLPELTSTCMTLELADRSVAHPKGVAEDVFVKVGKFYFLADFVVVDYDVDPRVPLILGRPFLRTARALIDVYGEELTLRVDDEAITFKVGQTSRYSRSYETVNQVNVIDVACEEYAQEVLGFSDSSSSGNPTPSDPIIASSSPSFTPFEGGDFILEEIETFLRTPKELSNLDDDYYDTEGDILYLEKLLNEDPSPTPPRMKNGRRYSRWVTMRCFQRRQPRKLELKDFSSFRTCIFGRDR